MYLNMNKQSILTLLILTFCIGITVNANTFSELSKKSAKPLTIKSVMATSYYSSTQDGYWHLTSTWTGGLIPPTSGTNNLDITINHYVTYDGATSGDPMQFSNQFTLTVKTGATLEIFADITINNNFTFIVEPGGSLIIHGSMSMGNVIEGIIDGGVAIDGDLTVGGGGASSSITGSGTLTVGGTVSDPNGIVLPTLIDNVRYLVVDGGAWADPNSWASTSGGTPGATIPSDQTNVYIENGFDVTIPSSVLLQDIEISAGSIVTVSPGATLQVTNIVNNGQIVLSASALGSGALLYNGTTPGIVSYYKFLSAYKFHYVSSPYTDAPYTDYYTTIYDAANPNFYSYDETDITDPINGWKTVTGGIITPGQGYGLYYNRDYAYPLTGTTLNVGNVNINVTYTSSGVAADDGWNLLGNPYPANIDANAFLNANNTGTIDGTLYYWDDDGSNGTGYATSDYSTYTLAGGVAGDNGTVPNGFIAPGQAFFIKAAANGTVAFTDAMKTASAGTIFKSTEAIPSNGNPNLRLSLTNNQSGYNETLITFSDKYTAGYDNFYDGRKKEQSSNIALYSLLSDDKLAIQALPTINQDVDVKLGLYANVSGTYTLSAKSIENFDILVGIYLYDKQLDKIVDLKTGAYTFTANGSINDRFVIKFKLNNQTYTRWNGTASDNFYDETKWDNGLPSSVKSVIISAGTVAKLSGAISCRDLKVEAGGAFVLDNGSFLDIQNGVTIDTDKNKWGVILDNAANQVNAHVTFNTDNNYFENFSSPVSDAKIQQISDLTDEFIYNYMGLQNKWGEITNASQQFFVTDGYQYLPNQLKNRELNGILNTGSYDIYLNTGFNYIGNPYMSYIDWGNANSQTGWTLSDDIAGSVWTAFGKSNDLNTTSYAVYNRMANVGVNNASRNIAPMQAFWVYSANEAAMSVDNKARKYAFSENDAPSVTGLRLKVTGNSLTDETVVAFSDKAGDNYDSYDSYKMMATDNNYPQLYSVDYDNKKLAINTLRKKDWNTEVAVNLVFTAGNAGEYTISLSDIGNFDTDVSAFIVDEFGTSKLITAEQPYTFNYTATGTDKLLTLKLLKGVTGSESGLEQVNIYTQDKEIYIDIPASLGQVTSTVFDVTGRMVQSTNLSSGSNCLRMNLGGVYLIKLNSGTENLTHKVMIP